MDKKGGSRVGKVLKECERNMVFVRVEVLGEVKVQKYMKK